MYDFDIEQQKKVEQKNVIDREYEQRRSQPQTKEYFYKRPAENDVQILGTILDAQGNTNVHLNEYKDENQNKIIEIKHQPFKDRLSTNLTTANYNEREKYIAFELASVSETQQFISQQFGDVDLSASADYYTDLLNILSSITKGYQMAAPRLVRTTRTEGQMEENIKNFNMESQKKKWLGLF